jgi:hypothetical protein
MIKKFNDFETTRSYTSGSESLPRGGYVCKIMGAKPIETKFGQSIKVAFDIAEGDYAGYYQAKYNANTNEDKKWPGVYLLNVPNDDGSQKDGWTKRKFRTFTDALEDSNAGYHFDWDETKFKGKLIGFVFNYREFETSDGGTGWTPNAQNSTSAQKIRDGKFKIPEDRPLKNRPAAPTPNANDFVAVPAGTEEEVPF